MECPFCAETIREEAQVCKNCARDLALVGPIIREIQELTVEIDSLQRELNRVQLKQVMTDAPARFLLIFALMYVVLPSALLVGAHLLVTFVLDALPIYLRIASILIPLPFGFALAVNTNIGFRGALAIGFVTSFVSVWSMLAVTGNLDHVPVMPANWIEWKETLEYGLSIAMAFGAGNLLGYVLYEALPRTLISSGKPSPAAYWLARACGQHAGKGVLRRRARLLQDILRTTGPLLGFIATAGGSIYSGLKGFLTN
jgi:hypothetical protein